MVAFLLITPAYCGNVVQHVNRMRSTTCFSQWNTMTSDRKNDFSAPKQLPSCSDRQVLEESSSRKGLYYWNHCLWCVTLVRVLATSTFFVGVFKESSEASLEHWQQQFAGRFPPKETSWLWVKKNTQETLLIKGKIFSKPVVLLGAFLFDPTKQVLWKHQGTFAHKAPAWPHELL